MTCDDVQPMLSALLDAELDASDMAAVREHLAGCAACRETSAQMTASRDAMRTLPKIAAPDLLRARVAAELKDWALVRPPAAAATRARKFRFMAGQVAAAVLLVAGSSLITRGVLHKPVDLDVSQLVARHVNALMTNHLTDVVSNDEHNVKPWFDGKVPFAPAVPRLDSVGFPLIGGRVDTVGGAVTAALVYGRRKHVINVFARPAAATNVRDASTITWSASEHGYNVVRWIWSDMQYAAVSDVSAGDLEEFVKMFRGP